MDAKRLSSAENAWALGGLAAAAAAGFAVVRTLNLPGDAAPVDPTAGEFLIHGLHPALGMMPLKQVLPALWANHLPFGFETWVAALGAALVLAVGAAALWNGSLAAGLGAAALTLLLTPRLLSGWAQITLSAAFALCAGTALWREERPGPARDAALAAAIGVSLFYRSVLVLLPPLLAAREWRLGRKRSAAVLLAVPYLFLLPYVAMNAGLEGRFALFEHEEADSNLVAGALGHVTGIEGPWTALVEGRDDAPAPGAVKGWAAREILRHPLRYAGAVARRTGFLLGAHPLLLLLCAAGLALARRRAGPRLLALFLLYFLGVHVLMAVHRTYLTPFYVLAAAGAGLLLPGPPAPALARRAALAVWLALGAGFAAAYLFTAARCLRAAFGAETELGAAAAAAPRDAWLQRALGTHLTVDGEFTRAAAAFENALRLAPLDRDARYGLARARFALGLPDLLFKFKLDRVRDVHFPRAIRLSTLRALARRRAGDAAGAAFYLDEARMFALREIDVGEDLFHGAVEREARARLLDKVRARLLEAARDELELTRVPAAERERLLKDLGTPR